MEDQRPILIYKKLRRHFGFLNWWPGDTNFEIFVGAMLTQQTQWRNVELALANLKESNSLSLEKIARMPLPKLQKFIRSSGFYKQKAARLKAICSDIMDKYGTLDVFLAMNKEKLEKELLSYKGIGNETADSIMLYAANRKSFVIDAYTKRIMSRTSSHIGENAPYKELQSYFEDRLSGNIVLYKDFHAQFVELGKAYCKPRPLCTKCPLIRSCSYGRKYVD